MSVQTRSLLGGLTVPTVHIWVGLIGLAGIAGCKGSIEGAVYGTGSNATQKLADVDVVLVQRSDSFLVSLKQFCENEKAAAAARAVERKRLETRATMMRDSAQNVFGLEYQSPRWQRLADAAKAAWDSSSQLSIADTDPATLAEQVAVQHARTDGEGHYRLTGVRWGHYFVVPLSRESAFAAYLWYPTRVRVGTTHLDANENDGWAGCHLLDDASPATG